MSDNLVALKDFETRVPNQTSTLPWASHFHDSHPLNTYNNRDLSHKAVNIWKAPGTQ